MRLGLISGEYPPMQGGVGDFTRELAQALAALGHEPHVITNYPLSTLDWPSAKSPTPEGGSGGQATYYPPWTGRQGRLSNFAVHRQVKHWGWGCWAAIRAVTRAQRLDVLNVQYQAAAYRMHPAINLLPAVRHWLGLPPIVTTFHDMKVPYLFPKAGPLRTWVVHELACRSDGVIVTNHEDEYQISNTKYQISNLQRIPIGSNIKPEPAAQYQRDEWRARWGAGPDDVLIGYFGFLHPLKGSEVLVQALAQLAGQGQPVKALFIGGKTGSSDADTNAVYAARVEALANESGLAGRIASTGYVPPPEVTAAFYACDVLALPYLEGASLRHGTLMAALAHGRAIVTTRSSVPSPELRAGENVLLVSPGDPGELATSLARTINSPALRARLERGALELSQQFTWDIIAARTLDAYRQAIQFNLQHRRR